MHNIVFFGPPGAGKGTQAKLIGEYFNISHLSTGDILRKKLQDNDNLAQELKKIMSSGNLVSDEILNSIVSSRLRKENNGFILDGYPRTLIQSEFLNKFLLEISKSINFIFNIQINFETLKNRILKRSSEEGREDDNINVIETRYNEYLNSTQKVSNFYKNEFPTIFHEIDGSSQIREITEKIMQILKKS